MLYGNGSIPEQPGMALSAGSQAEFAVTEQGYINLIKASWLVIGVIVRQPQLNCLDSGVRYDVELLANVRPTEPEEIHH